MTSEESWALVNLAKEKGLRFSSSPITYMGEAQDAAWSILESGKLGTVRLVYAEVNHGFIEAWHPNPQPFYDLGVIWDVAVYPLTLMTAFLLGLAMVGASESLPLLGCCRRNCPLQRRRTQ